MKISKRLKAIASLVNNDEVVIDVGTDHALLIIYLIKKQIIKYGYGSDLRQGPLNSAQQNVELFALQDKIKLILCDGLNDLPLDASTIIIAGMGGETIINILKGDLKKINNQTLILQPNTQVSDVRRFLLGNGFKIIDENIIYEDGHYYEMIKVNKGHQILTPDEIDFGPILLSKKSDIFKKKYQKEIDKCTKILNKLDDTYNKRKQELKEYIERIKVIL